jgi:hypothetical protein
VNFQRRFCEEHFATKQSSFLNRDAVGWVERFAKPIAFAARPCQILRRDGYRCAPPILPAVNWIASLALVINIDLNHVAVLKTRSSAHSNVITRESGDRARSNH